MPPIALVIAAHEAVKIAHVVPLANCTQALCVADTAPDNINVSYKSCEQFQIPGWQRGELSNDMSCSDVGPTREVLLLLTRVAMHYGEPIEIAVSINCPDPQNE